MVRVMARYITQEINVWQKKKEDDSDIHLARRLMKDKQYCISGQEYDEYGYDDGPSKRSKKAGRDEKGTLVNRNYAKHLIIQQERCRFCFENPNRPKHLVVAIANLTYLAISCYQHGSP
ncbi:hypothetical protein Ancab_013207 [Ancistrocladus abbreviatus]